MTKHECGKQWRMVSGQFRVPRSPECGRRSPALRADFLSSTQGRCVLHSIVKDHIRVRPSEEGQTRPGNPGPAEHSGSTGAAKNRVLPGQKPDLAAVLTTCHQSSDLVYKRQIFGPEFLSP